MMDAIREQLKNPLYVGIGAFVLGLIIGLVVLGWWLWPVQYTGAGLDDLKYDAKVEYLRTAIEAYSATRDATVARARYEALGDERANILTDIAANPAGLSTDVLASFIAAAGAQPGQVAEATTAPGAATPAAGTPAGSPVATTAPAAEEGGGRSLLTTLATVLCAVVLVGGAGLLAFFYLRNRPPRLAGPVSTAGAPTQAPRQTAWTDYTSGGAEPPMSQFMASYKLGDDLFDDSFSIDSPAGEFLGECGVGISETIGVGDPKRVTAFEVWLFDKNDIQTVTKVLMSAHAYNDEAARQRLAAKGEPVLAEPGSETVLETQTLQLVARVIDMAYGDGALPAESFFDRFVIELAVWPKA